MWSDEGESQSCISPTEDVLIIKSRPTRRKPRRSRQHSTRHTHISVEMPLEGTRRVKSPKTMLDSLRKCPQQVLERMVVRAQSTQHMFATTSRLYR